MMMTPPQLGICGAEHKRVCIAMQSYLSNLKKVGGTCGGAWAMLFECYVVSRSFEHVDLKG